MAATTPAEQVSSILVKMLTDNDILPVPSLRSGKDDPKVLGLYFERMPTIGVIYATINNKIVDYNEKQLKREWRLLFKKGTLYELLLPRYSVYTQPLLEIHKESKIIEQLQQRIYRRVTAYSWDLVVGNLVACAFFLYEKNGQKEIMIRTPPKLTIVK